jgi:predicted nuclease with TOPRIM domain
VWIRYLSPDDLSADQAQRVLDFLNGVQTAREIADRVEYPGELDVGLRVAQRILDRRAALGGAFTDIEQVATVPYVGPERFTEIVVAITDYRPPGTTAQTLQDELDRLYARLGVASGAVRQLHVTLRPVLPRTYLGQRLSLVVEVTRMPDERPARDVPVTLLTSWGRIASVDGFSTQQDPSVTLRTGVDGTCRATLIAVTDEPVRWEQQVALDAVLESLDPGAQTPREVEGQLAEIARRYRVTENTSLRGAIDIYFKFHARARLDAINAVDPLSAWPIENATVVAHVQEGLGAEPLSTVGATAVHTVAFRNWLPAWLALYRDRARSESGLSGQLGDLLAAGSNASYVLPSAYRRIQQYVAGEWGMVGELVGREIAEKTIEDFVRTGLPDIPIESRLAIRDGLGAASSTIKMPGGRNLLQSLSQTQAVARSTSAATETGLQASLQNLNAQLSQISGSVSRLDGDLATLHDTVAVSLPRLQADLETTTEAMNNLRFTMDTTLPELRRELQDSAALVAALRTDLDGLRIEFDTEFGQFDGRITQMDSRLNEVNTRLGQIDNNITRIDSNMTALDGRVSEANTNLTEVNSTLTRLDSEVSRKADAGAFETFRGQVDTNLQALTTDVNVLKTRPTR